MQKEGVEADISATSVSIPQGEKPSYNYGGLISWKMIFGQYNCTRGIKPMENF